MTRRGTGTLHLRTASTWADREADAIYEEGERASDTPPCAGPRDPESPEARKGYEDAERIRQRIEREEED